MRSPLNHGMRPVKRHTKKRVSIAPRAHRKRRKNSSPKQRSSAHPIRLSPRFFCLIGLPGDSYQLQLAYPIL
jgi:hypothetical protein